MRLSEEKIKQAILHCQLEIRQRAVRYFSVCHSEDECVVPLVIQAVEKYGREDAYHLVGGSVNLRHTEETVSWVIEELQDPAAERYENYVFNLNRVLCHVDPALLIHRDTEILESGHFYRDMRDHFTRRLELLSWDEAACWRQLEQICEDGKDKRYVNEVDLSFANAILEALARIGDEVEQRVLSVLSQKFENFEQNPMKWMESLMVILAGLLQMDAAIPMILGKLHEDDSLLAGNCIEALSRVGTDAVVAVIAEDFAAAERHFRLYAANVFENIHSDLSVERAVDLLATEKDQQVQRDLAHAALSHFDQKAVEPVRKLIRSQLLDGDLSHLRDYLVETCTILEERFPEYDEWQAAGKLEREERRKQVDSVKDDPTAALAWALGRAKDYFPSDEPEDQKERLPASNRPSFNEPLLDRSEADAKRVGRNDPCPCGSGKKYKKCCMRK